MKNSEKKVPTRNRKYIALSAIFVGVITVGAHLFLGGSGISSVHNAATTAMEDGQSYLGSMLFASFDVPFKEHLKGMKIEPNVPGGITVLPNETVRLTSVGIFATWEQQIQANWFLFRGSSSKEVLSDCQGVRTCSYTADSNPGSVDIRAESAGMQDTATIHVNGEILSGFKDNVPDWAKSSVHSLSSIGIVKGYADGTYGSADTLTQGQVITLLYRALLHANRVQAPEGCYDYSIHVPAGHYAYEALCTFFRNGWEQSGAFEPNKSISRAETAAYIYVVLGNALMENMGIMQGSVYVDGQIFTDVPQSHSRFYEISVANKTGIMTGNPNGSFGPSSTLNRAEAAIVIYRLLQQMENM